ncbi:MAG: protein kinase [Acidobacteriota bacterium]
MGAVFLAHDSSLDRRVAIKFLSDDLTADEIARKRLVREARAAARLDHSNICSVYEVAEQEGLTFIVMQYVEGETLAEKIERKPMEMIEVLDVAVQVADALAEAHSHGIIHRDIKPQNIMLTARGQVKVLDFGLAKIVRREEVTGSEIDIESLMSGPGMIAGTVPYMSPEQVRSEAIDGRSDIFSFGVVLYEMIAGRQPFVEESTAATVSAILTKEPPSLARYSRELPTELERIVSKALQKDRDERYQTARDLLIDLKSLKHHLEFEEELEHSLPPDTGEGGKPPPVTAANEPVDTISLAATQTVTTAAYLRGTLKRHRRGLIIAAATLVLAIATLIYVFYFPARGKAIESIAVLPLVNASNNPETEYLSDGITDSLINSLCQVKQLRKVVARTTAFRYKGKEIDPQQVGRELGVQAILTGRLIQRGDNLTIQVDLVETSEGSQIWGERYHRKLSELLVVQRELAREITERLGLRLSGEDEKRLTKGGTDNTEACTLYLKGRHLWNRRTVADIRKSIEMFQQAITEDPNYALAYVGLADGYTALEAYDDSIPTSETLPKARAAVQQALQIDDSLGEAHASLAAIEQHSWNFSEAEREYKRAIELSPNYATVHHWFSRYLRLVRGRFDEAMAEIRLAQQLDPLSPAISINVAYIYCAKGEMDTAIEAAKKVLDLNPNWPEAVYALGISYRKQGRYDKAIAELEKAAELSARRSYYLGPLGVCYALAGKEARARAILKEIEEKYHRGEAHGQNLADLYAALGDRDQAFAWLEKDFQARSGFLLLIAHSEQRDTLRDALSSDPRWRDLLRRIGLPQN